MSDEGQLVLLRLAERVEQLAEWPDRISGTTPVEGSAFRFESPGAAFSARNDDDGDRLVRSTRPPLPDPRLVRRIIRQRQLRARFFGAELFADPARDMLLDLTAARTEHKRVSVYKPMHRLGHASNDGVVLNRPDDRGRPVSTRRG